MPTSRELQRARNKSRKRRKELHEQAAIAAEQKGDAAKSPEQALKHYRDAEHHWGEAYKLRRRTNGRNKGGALGNEAPGPLESALGLQLGLGV